MINKQILLYLLVSLIFSLNLDGKTFNKNATIKPTLIQQGKERHWCPICGMSIKKFYKTSHGSKLHNGTKRQYCSIRCLAVDMQEYQINTSAVVVVDAKTQMLINAKDAFYVMGSKVKGTMTKVSKLAFKSKDDAVKFTKKYKGKIVTFDTALKTAQESLKSDIAMVRKKKKKKIYPMGKKIFEKMCDKKIDLSNYLEINELKADIRINKLCKKSRNREISDNQLQAVSVYLWEVKRFRNINSIESKVVVSEDENLTDKEIYMLIFAAGLSTADKVSDISGRGVGMDVVKRNIEDLRGTVEIDSTEGEGSLFTIRLPLTLAIMMVF